MRNIAGPLTTVLRVYFSPVIQSTHALIFLWTRTGATFDIAGEAEMISRTTPVGN